MPGFAIGGMRPLAEVAEDEPGQQAHEQPALAGVAGIVVVDVAEDGRARIEVVAVLLAADACRAIAVAHHDDGGLTVGALDRRERAERAAPAAAALEDEASREG